MLHDLDKQCQPEEKLVSSDHKSPLHVTQEPIFRHPAAAAGRHEPEAGAVEANDGHSASPNSHKQNQAVCEAHNANEVHELLLWVMQFVILRAERAHPTRIFVAPADTGKEVKELQIRWYVT